MDHLTSSRLVDYARGLLDGLVRSETERHLATCRECEATVAFFRRLHESASGVIAPKELVSQAKALFVSPGRLPLLRRVVARLASPDLGGLRLAEVRTVDPVAHHFLFRWNQYCMDLRLDKEPESASVSLLGQIANELAPDIPVGGVPVTLTAGDRVIAETRCNSRGEFCIEFAPERGMRVRFDVQEAEVSIDVPLSKLRI